MIHDARFLAAAFTAVFLVGLAKGGFSGVGTLATPILALVISPVQAAAILLPILILQDAVSVWVFRHEWNRGVVVVMLPSAAAGIGLGYVFAARVTPAAVGLVVGVISIVFAVRQMWLTRTPLAAPAPPSRWWGPVAGAAAGFTSQIAHAGAPPFQMYVLPLGLSRNMFVGTSAVFFAALNWLKVPAYIGLGQFTRATLGTSVLLMPVAFASTWAGIHLVRRVPAERFYRLVYVLMILIGLRLVWVGAAQATQATQAA